MITGKQIEERMDTLHSCYKTHDIRVINKDVFNVIYSKTFEDYTGLLNNDIDFFRVRRLYDTDIK